MFDDPFDTRVGWSGILASPSSPVGGGGPGFFRSSGPLGLSLALDGNEDLVHVAPALRHISHVAQVDHATNSHVGLSFDQRLKAFLLDARTRYQVTFAHNAEFRKPEDAQKWHIAHMFCYNSYAAGKHGVAPAQYEIEDKTHKVIAWNHISDARLSWFHVKWEDFLADKDGKVPVKSPDGKTWSVAPDKAKSKAKAYKILESAHIAKSPDSKKPHSAMVAPGYDGCGEPCKCGVHASRHTLGKACDLDQHALPQLEHALANAKAGSLDHYLKSFGLHRPMLHGHNAEPWHIEAIP